MIDPNRDCYIANKTILIPCKTTEFSKANGDQEAVAQFKEVPKDKEPPKNSKIVEINGLKYVLLRFWNGTEQLWIEYGKKWPKSDWANIKKTKIKYIKKEKKEQLSLF